MTPKGRRQCQKISTFLGGFFVLLPNGITWLWGNLSVYIFSYFHAKDSNSNNSQIQAPWLMSIYISVWSIAMIMATYVEKCLGRKKTFALGMISFNLGVVSSYFVFEVSINLMNLTMGVLAGIGNGLIHSMVMQCVVEWAEDSQVGMFTSIVISGYSLGSIVTNQFVTHYVNPNNLKPSDLVGPTRYFDQKDILNRVPKVFLFYGLGAVILDIIGFCLLRKKPHGEGGENNHFVETANSVTGDTTERRNILENRPESNFGVKRTTLNRINTSERLAINAEFNGRDINNGINSESSITKLSPSLDAEHLENNQNSNPETLVNVSSELSNHELSPKEMFKTKSFYCLWLSLLLIETAYIVPLNYYKTFGQVWIKDDHFLTDLGTASACMVFGARLLWGVVLDRIGVKPTMVSFFSAVSLVSTFYYFTPRISRWFYLFWTLLFFSLSCGVLTNFTVAVVKIFGKKHFAVNNGIMFTATIISNLAAPPIIQLVLTEYGWFELFFGVAVINFIGLMLIVTLLMDS